jgi:tetratricopeptide (TPR) repeat protein
MAQFGEGGSQIRKMEEGLSKIPIPERAFAFDKTDEEGFMTRFERMTQAARERQARQKADIRLDDRVGVDLGTTLVDQKEAEVVSRFDRLLQEVKRLIAEEKYEEAIPLLLDAVAESPGHHEATYLLAFCHVRLRAYEKALETLLPLRRARLDNALAVRVDALKEDIRSEMLFVVLIENFLLLKTKQFQEAINRIHRIASLDPDVGTYHFILAGSLMTANHLEPALQAVNYGLSECRPGDRAELESLKSQIEHRYLAYRMRPARDYLKKEHYRQARGVLRGLPTALHRVPLYKTFDVYLAALDAGVLGNWLHPKRPKDVIPSGSPKDVDALYFFLVGEELDQAKQYIEQEQFLQAAVSMQQALDYTPQFPFANYLYSVCLYRKVFQQFAAGAPPSLENTTAELRRALGHARTGSTDREIAGADDLIETIEDALKTLDAIRTEMQVRQQEVKRVNEVIEEFQTIMEDASGGVRSVQHYNSLLQRMRQLMARLPTVRQQVKGQDAQEALTQLSEAVQRNLNQLESMQSSIQDSEMVSAIYTRFNGKMEELNRNPIRSYSELESAKLFFSSLKSEVGAAQKRVTDRQGRQALDKLLAAINGVLSQFHA